MDASHPYLVITSNPGPCARPFPGNFFPNVDLRRSYGLTPVVLRATNDARIGENPPRGVFVLLGCHKYEGAAECPSTAPSSDTRRNAPRGGQRSSSNQLTTL